jgi:hypothetical protein
MLAKWYSIFLKFIYHVPSTKVNTELVEVTWAADWCRRAKQYDKIGINRDDDELGRILSSNS